MDNTQTVPYATMMKQNPDKITLKSTETGQNKDAMQPQK